MAHAALLLEQLRQKLVSGENIGINELEELYKFAYKQGYNDRKEEEQEDE